MRTFFSLFLIFSLNVWGADLELPTLTSPVMDLAGLLSEGAKADLSNLAYEINAHNGPQMTILTVPDMQGYPIEEYSIRVAEKWQLGTKEKDNGLLVIIAKAERQMRIEVGNGIEGEITDYDTSEYTRKIFPEYFRNGDFHGGLRLFMEDVAKRFNIKLEGTGNSFVRRAPQRTGRIGNFLILALIGAALIGSMIRNRAVKGLFTGASFSGIAFFLGFPFVILIFAFFFGLFFGLIGASNVLSGMAHGRRYGGGRFGGGGFGGGGGWSGGGGGFSGGGSSGSW